MEIAIDGFSACGKSTLAKSLAKELEAVYIDTGAMYRAVTLYFIHQDINIASKVQVNKALDEIEISFDTDSGSNDCLLNGINVEIEIRSREVSDKVSNVAAVSEVRKKLVDLQRNMSKSKNIVMDGRDIGTVVFPNALFKFFLTANADIRAKRRLEEYQSKGVKAGWEDVLKNLEKRDHIDSTRQDSPLKVAEDALIIDNSFLSRAEQLELVLRIVT